MRVSISQLRGVADSVLAGVRTGVTRVMRYGAAFALAVGALSATSDLASAQAALDQGEQKSTAPLPPGENASVDSARAIRGQSLRVALLTIGPSDIVFERFGHNALTVRDTVTGEDWSFNWGMFSFQQPNFYTRFLTGDTHYWMETFPTAPWKQQYVENNRSIRQQQLALTAVERAALFEFMVWNSQEVNKYYRYDYYQDNCATRVRDALDRVLKGRLKAALDTIQTPMTWRGETERVTASNIAVYSGIELALGRNADAPQKSWGISFMPERFAEFLPSVILKTDDGQRYRLVANDTMLFEATRVPMPIDPPDRLAMAALLGLTVAGFVALLADSRFKVLRGILVAFATLWYLIGGILGTALLLAGTATKHIPYMGANTTLWQIHPLMLFAALFVPVALYRRQTTQIPRILATICAMFAVFGLLLQFVPMFAQKSGVVLAVTVPVHIALAVAVMRTAVVVPPRRKVAAAAASRVA